MCDMGCLKLTEVHHVSEQVAVDDGKPAGRKPPDWQSKIHVYSSRMPQDTRDLLKSTYGITVSWPELEQNPDVQAGLRKELDKQAEQEQE